MERDLTLEIRFLLATSLLAEARDLSGNKSVVDGEVGRAERVDEFLRFPSTPFTSAIPKLTVLYASLSSSDHPAIISRVINLDSLKEDVLKIIG